MLVFRTFLRSLRGGQFTLVLASLALAVAVVTSVALLADRVEKALIDESSAFLAADLVLESNSLIEPRLSAKAREMELQTSTMMTFVSMVYSEEEMHLASVRAIDKRYPLRGELSYSMFPFSADPDKLKVAKSGPPSGETWVDARILPLLKIELGDYLEFGDIKLRVSRVLIDEPDSRGSFSFYGARILINIDDVAPAGVILAGSRVKHKLLVALPDEINPVSLTNYREWLAGHLTIHQRIIDPEMAEARIAKAIDRGRRFLLLAGSVGLVLSAIALALASHQFAVDEVMQVGLFKSWGFSRGRIRRFYLGYGLVIALVGATLGICIGAAVQESLVFLISDW
ncbi:MAG: FtsX-like permease family protein, partial [Cellvibrionales bacterium TMED148]